jgi:hypothetical protein
MPYPHHTFEEEVAFRAKEDGVSLDTARAELTEIDEGLAEADEWADAYHSPDSGI